MSAVKDFSTYIIMSSKCACVLTDSKPCIQAYGKLCRGEFSASPRVSTYNSYSRFLVSVQHLSGAANVVSDFASHNAPNCEERNCQICPFVTHTKNSVVMDISVQDIIGVTPSSLSTVVQLGLILRVSATNMHI